MFPTAATETIAVATAYLQQQDPVLAAVIAAHGLCDITPHRDYYQALVTEIIGQQLSVKAAASIRQKFLALFDGTFPAPGAILEKTIDQLRSAGLSGAKARYIQDLAQHMLQGTIKFERFDGLTNEEIIKELVAVKGIGEWTAHMFLMFCMGRLDVLPVGDLGIKNGIRALYDFKDAPTPNQITELAEKNSWHPYESVASWYVWASLDNKPI